GARSDGGEEDVLVADVLVVEALGLLVAQLHHFPRPVGKALVHTALPSARPDRTFSRAVARQPLAGARREACHPVSRTAPKNAPPATRAPPLGSTRATHCTPHQPPGRREPTAGAETSRS